MHIAKASSSSRSGSNYSGSDSVVPKTGPSNESRSFSSGSCAATSWRLNRENFQTAIIRLKISA
ncbi:MAG TPA: hypothetical protein VEL70_01695 [Candidatus Acidoferrum sp.]|nr:hypothetical protein [Candidatus Acidoferrum sp.]